MKRNIHVIMVFLLLVFCGCSKNGYLRLSSDDSSVRIDGGETAEVTVGPDGGRVSIFVDSSSDWTLDDVPVQWCTAESSLQCLVVLVEPFMSSEMSRSVILRIRNSDGAESSVYISQTSQPEAFLTLGMTECSLPSRGGTVEIPVETGNGDAVSCSLAESLVNFLTIEYDESKKVIRLGAEKNITGMNLDAIVRVSSGEGIRKVQKDLKVRQGSGKMVFRYKTDKDGLVVALPLYGLVDITVEWGDNSSDQYKMQISSDMNVGYITHWYERAGEYDIAITGSVERIYGNGIDRCNLYLKEIVQWGDNGIKSLEKAFYGTDITYVPSPDAYSFTSLSNVSGAFENCSSLETVATDIFDSAKSISDFSSLFKGCTSLSGESPYSTVGGKKVHIYERTESGGFAVPDSYAEAFSGCDGLEDYMFIPDDWK